jgi:hypothetical protein
VSGAVVGQHLVAMGVLDAQLDVVGDDVLAIGGLERRLLEIDPLDTGEVLPIGIDQ